MQPRKSFDGESGQASDIGGAVRRLRVGMGLRQGDLAKMTGMSAAQLCHIEKDRNAPSVRTLRRIADALGVPLSELTAGTGTPAAAAPETTGHMPLPGEAVPGDAAAPPPRPKPPEARGRDFADTLLPVGPVTLADLPQAARTQVRKRILEYRDVEIAAGVPTRPSLPLDYPAEIAAGDPEALAVAVRRAAGIGDAVLFDPIAMLETKGVRVVMADLPEGIDAFALWEGAVRNAWIMVRKASTDERQLFRASCALADVLRFASGGARSPVPDTPAAKSFARGFAAAFLMPAAALRELCYRLALRPDSWSWELLLREKRRFAVSAEAFAWRLESLGLLRASLKREFVSRAREWFERNGAEPEPSRRKDTRHSRFGDLKILAAIQTKPAKTITDKP